MVIYILERLQLKIYKIENQFSNLVLYKFSNFKFFRIPQFLNRLLAKFLAKLVFF